MIYSFGHSTYDQETALGVLGDVATLVDARSHPTSKWPQWTKPELELWVPQSNIQYAWFPELGGWDSRHIPLIDEMDTLGVDIRPYTKGFFPKGRIGRKLNLPTPAWTVAGFWDYQWFMTLPEFEQGIGTIVEMSDRDIAIMCAELIPWSCHRSMIADYLLHLHNVDVVHLQPKQKAHSEWPSRLDRYDPRALKMMRANAGL